MNRGNLQIAWAPVNTASRIPVEKAVAALRAVVAAQPDRAEFRLMLAQILFERGSYAEIEGLVGVNVPAALAAQADFHRGRAANQMGDAERAVALLRHAASDGIANAHGELATALARSGRRADAIAAAREGLARDPADIACLRLLGTLLLEQGGASEACELAQSLWSRGICRTQVVWTMAWAARALGHADAFAALVARDPWFAVERLDLDNAALAQEILSSDTLAPSQAYKPTRGHALRIDDFESVAGPATAALHKAVREAVLRYQEARQARADHPLIAGWPRRMALESWALAMSDDGYEDWHIHPSAWLSAVYYVRNPAARGEGPAGRIGFGALPLVARMAGCPFPEWTIAPEPGLLVLFPAWYAHRTWPTGAPTERISVAFNAKPA
ncbi:MAG TPA: putative 2OG-Fe(II) oxygenase [Rhizomicrobium sp.]|nr:putative 2OG-Fe(II) oxygenase [Rhizomicrobium sp.]